MCALLVFSCGTVTAQNSSEQPPSGVRLNRHEFAELNRRFRDQSAESILKFAQQELELPQAEIALGHASLSAEILEQRNDWKGAGQIRRRAIEFAEQKFGESHWRTRLAHELAEHTLGLSGMDRQKAMQYLSLRREYLIFRDWADQHPWELDLQRAEATKIAESARNLLGSDDVVGAMMELPQFQSEVACGVIEKQAFKRLQQLSRTFSQRLGACPQGGLCHRLMSEHLYIRKQLWGANAQINLAMNAFKGSVDVTNLQYNFTRIQRARIHTASGQFAFATSGLQEVLKDCERPRFELQMMRVLANYRLSSMSRIQGDMVRATEFVGAAATILNEGMLQLEMDKHEEKGLRNIYVERLGGLQEMAAIMYWNDDIQDAMNYYATDAVRKRDRGTNQPEIAKAFRYLATAELKAGGKWLDHARKHAEFSRDVLAKLDSYKSDYYESLRQLARIEEAAGNLSAASELYNEITEHFREGPDANSRLVLNSLSASVRVDTMLGNTSQAIKQCRRLLASYEKFAHDQLLQMPIDRAERHLLGPLMGAVENLLFLTDESDPVAVGLAFDWACKINGLGTEAERVTLNRIRNSRQLARPSDLIDQFVQARSNLGHILLHDYHNIAERRSEIVELQRSVESLHNQILKELESAGARMEVGAGAQALLARIPADTAYVDFWSARDPATRRRHTVAFVVCKETSDARDAIVKLIRLSPNEVINDQVRGWKSAFFRVERLGGSAASEDIDAANSRLKQFAAELWQSVWSKVAPRLEDAQHVVVCPNQDLWQVPFAALVDPESGGFLAQDKSIATVHNSHQFIRLIKEDVERPDHLLAIGGLNYGGDGERDVKRTVTSFQFKPLGFSGKEVESLGGNSLGWRTSTQITSLEATEPAIADALSSTQYDQVHLATHAFALKLGRQFDRLDQVATPASVLFGSGLRERNRNSFSGIVLSGANDATLDDAHNQILSSEELELMNLSHLKFAVISGCNSSNGYPSWYEGIFGLQRSLYLAGVHASMGSMWDVDDQRTSEFMERFYFYYRGGSSKAEALAMAQREFIAADQPLTAWAAWTILGDWR